MDVTEEPVVVEPEPCQRCGQVPPDEVLDALGRCQRCLDALGGGEPCCLFHDSPTGCDEAYERGRDGW